MKTLKFLFTLIVLCFVAACTKDLPVDELSKAPVNGDNELKCKPAQVKIAVVSDIHYMAPSLLMNGAENGLAFQTYLAYDPKLIQFSDPIFRTAISKIQREKPDIVLIPGDLTKDGELVNHQAVASLLQKFIGDGIKVYVVPGNHDINNPEAAQYDGNSATPVPSITAGDFSSIYGDFGYDDAIYRDDNSLSYICQPYNGLWILGIDDCKYLENTNAAIVSGVIKDETMTWILEKLQYAKDNNITVLGMMHHGIVEHFMGQNQLDYGYVTDDWENKADALINSGLKVMFTGHYHANDITMRSSNGNILFDVETGSLVTPPSPYRVVTLSDKSLGISTTRITSINCTFPMGFSFTRFSDQFLSSHLDGYFAYILENMFGVPAEYAGSIAPLFRNGWMAHYAGDEKITPHEQVKDNMVGDPLLVGALQGVWTDLPPADNKFHFNMK